MPILITTSTLTSVFLPSHLFNTRHSFFKPLTPILKPRASSTVFVGTNSIDTVVVEKEVSISKNVLACPICYYPLSWRGNPGVSVDSTCGSILHCITCKKNYSGNETHLDMTVANGAKEYGEYMPLATEIFRIPLISFLYERGWRQILPALTGFPGPEKEFELTKNYLKPVLGGNIVDASCGSGLFSRHFAKSGLFSLVIALDYSESMLQECYKFIEEEANFPKENLILVRADISRLPFVSNSVDAVHAGAALHCWSSPLLAVAEISRILRPGGVFVASTCIYDGPLMFPPFMKDLRQTLTLISGSHQFVSERELEDLCRACGLVGFSCVRNGLFVMISATKPS